MAEQCEGIRRDGQRCGARAAKGGKLCAGHAGLGIAADPQRYSREGAKVSAEIRSARANVRRMSLLERMGAEIEARAAEIVAGYFEAGRRGDWRAFEALVTRVHGRPVERVTVEADPDPFGVAAMSQAERAALVARVVDAYPHLAELAPGTALVHPDAQTLH